MHKCSSLALSFSSCPPASVLVQVLVMPRSLLVHLAETLKQRQIIGGRWAATEQGLRKSLGLPHSKIRSFAHPLWPHLRLQLACCMQE